MGWYQIPDTVGLVICTGSVDLVEPNRKRYVRKRTDQQRFMRLITMFDSAVFIHCVGQAGKLAKGIYAVLTVDDKKESQVSQISGSISLLRGQIWPSPHTQPSIDRNSRCLPRRPGWLLRRTLTNEGSMMLGLTVAFSSPVFCIWQSKTLFSQQGPSKTLKIPRSTKQLDFQ